MKKLFLFIGIFIVLGSLLSLQSYITDYAVLSQYGKGYIWGKIILAIVGIGLVYVGLKPSKIKK